MEAFNPFVPLNSEDFGIPAICFNITVENPTDRLLLASVAGSLQNAVGWDGVAPITDTRCECYGGNSNALLRVGDRTIISMGNAWLPADSAGWGTMALSVREPNATYLTQWDDLGSFWEDFAADGRLGDNLDSAPSATGKPGMARSQFRCDCNQASRARLFTLAWHFPNRYVNYSQRPFFGLMDENQGSGLANDYNSRFRSAADVVLQDDQNREELTRLPA